MTEEASPEAKLEAALQRIQQLETHIELLETDEQYPQREAALRLREISFNLYYFVTLFEKAYKFEDWREMPTLREPQGWVS